MKRFWKWRERKLMAKFYRLLARQKKHEAIYGNIEWGWDETAIKTIRGLRRCHYHLSK